VSPRCPDAKGAVPLQLQALHLRLPPGPGGAKGEGEGEGERRRLAWPQARPDYTCVYYIYAYLSSSVFTLEAGPKGH